MLNPIQPIRDVASIQFPEEVGSVAKAGGGDFRQILGEAIKSVEAAHTTASKEVDALLTGKGGELHSAVLATQRAELQFQLFLQVRNKVMTAYQQIMQTQV